MTDKLAWLEQGRSFVDGSQLVDWKKVFQSETWHWQYDTHELTYAIYLHDGQYWKLYLSRFVAPGAHEYSYGFGGVACRVVEVRYTANARSPHSALPKVRGDVEWIRTYEFDENIHEAIRCGETNKKYGAPYGLFQEGVAREGASS